MKKKLEQKREGNGLPRHGKKINSCARTHTYDAIAYQATGYKDHTQMHSSRGRCDGQHNVFLTLWGAASLRTDTFNYVIYNEWKVVSAISFHFSPISLCSFLSLWFSCPFVMEIAWFFLLQFSSQQNRFNSFEIHKLISFIFRQNYLPSWHPFAFIRGKKKKLNSNTIRDRKLNAKCNFLLTISWQRVLLLAIVNWCK